MRWSVIDLFCGVGGLSLGFERAGIPISAAFDNWQEAITVYNENFKHKAEMLDLSETEEAIRRLSQYAPNLIIGGPPCQDFSHAGKRKEGERANLTRSFSQIVANLKPEWFVMENVDRAQKSKAFQEAEEIFRENGYGITKIVLDASLCGAPQKRKRFFCIGHKNDCDDFLAFSLLSNMNKQPMTVKQYFKDDIKIEHYYRHPRNYTRRAVFSVNEPAPTIRGVNRHVPPNYNRHPGDTENPAKVRSLTTSERAQIQTFPKDFIWKGSKTSVEQMIGNAVPVQLGYFVAYCIQKYIQKN